MVIEIPPFHPFSRSYHEVLGPKFFSHKTIFEMSAVGLLTPNLSYNTSSHSIYLDYTEFFLPALPLPLKSYGKLCKSTTESYLSIFAISLHQKEPGRMPILCALHPLSPIHKYSCQLSSYCTSIYQRAGCLIVRGGQ